MGQARDGNVKALGVTSLRRSSIAPEYPPIADTLPGYDVSAFYGIGVRTGTSKEICDTIERDTQTVCYQQDFRDRLATFAAEATIRNTAEFSTLLGNERQKWDKLISELKIRTE